MIWVFKYTQHTWTLIVYVHYNNYLYKYLYNFFFQIIKSRINQKKTIETKASAIDFVTETDQEVEKLLIEGIKNKYPDHKYLCLIKIWNFLVPRPHKFLVFICWKRIVLITL